MQPSITLQIRPSNFLITLIIHAKDRGVSILLLLDKSNISARYGIVKLLENQEIPFLIDYRPRIAHNKILVSDEKTIITGSFNFTKAAQLHNAENVLIITDK